MHALNLALLLATGAAAVFGLVQARGLTSFLNKKDHR
jgi:hypothetical protein